MSDDSWRTCRICGETKHISMFYRDRKRNGEARIVRKFDCRDCARRVMRQRYQSNLDFIRNYKLEQGCADCGYREHAEALEFDHLPGVNKLAHVGEMMMHSRAAIEAEIAKCEVVCANCHRVRTKGRGAANAWHDLRRRGELPPTDLAPPFQQLQLDLGA
ncbi:hypothetical protein [Rhodococcus ruber]|uniref:hypothetical protein n=1 Tax=Rhodococcus ruber TaxID=1830 RepID=UPI001F2C3DB9|nr:hypothetical protein [Rhodococcus ruber]MCF8784124.1 hypothetical protein [Rhodococcus ruber]